MATAILVPPPAHGDGRFENMIERAKTEIRAKFAELVDQVRAREAVLLAELDTFTANYQAQMEECLAKKLELEEMRNLNKSNLNFSELRSMQQDFIVKIESKIGELEQRLLATSLHFVWDEEVSSQVSKLGRAQLVDTFTLAPKVEYKEKVRPTLRKCRVGRLVGDLDAPRVICVDSKSGNIFISEKRNNRVQCFDSNGDYLSTLGASGAARMRTPDGVAIRDDVVFVAQYDGHHVQMYSLAGLYIGKIGTNGRREGELDSPTGLAICKRSGFLYVCEWGNSRVQVFDLDSRSSCIFGDRDLERPIDIKLTGEEIFVMDETNPSIHVFNYEHQPLRSLISNGTGKQTADAYCFCIDMERNIYVTDYERNCVYIFNSNGELIHQIGSETSSLFSSPSGIALDMRGRIVVVDRSVNFGCLIFF